MKRLFALSAALIIAALLCGCGEKEPAGSLIVEETGYVSVDNEKIEAMTECIRGYLEAVSEHDHIRITELTEESFLYNYDETQFDEYCRYIDGFSIEAVGRENISDSAGSFCVPVSYSLNYYAPFVDYNGESQGSGSYSYSADFVLKETGDGFRIEDISDRPKG